MVTPTPEWDEVVEEVDDTLKSKLYGYAKVGALYVVDGTFFMSCLPRELLQSGRTITIYTYLAGGSTMMAYLRKLGIDYDHRRDVETDHNSERGQGTHHGQEDCIPREDCALL